MRRNWVGALVFSTALATQLAIGTPSARGDPPTALTITFSHITGDLCQGIEISGNWEASGALSDSGALTGFDFGARSIARTLTGTKGTIAYQFTFVDFVIGATGFTETDRWEILGGTGAYADLRAEGTGAGRATFTFSGDPDCPTVTDGHQISVGQVTSS